MARTVTAALRMGAEPKRRPGHSPHAASDVPAASPGAVSDSSAPPRNASCRAAGFSEPPMAASANRGAINAARPVADLPRAAGPSRYVAGVLDARYAPRKTHHKNGPARMGPLTTTAHV